MLSKVDTLKEKILSDIRSGTLKPGERLPSRHQFMRKYGCARGSIDAAINELTRFGFVNARRGSGTYVALTAPEAPLERVYIMGVSRFFAPFGGDRIGKLAACVQRETPCHIMPTDEIKLRLSDVTRPGTGAIWITPHYEWLMTLNYLAAAKVPLLLLGRTYGDYDYVTTDAEAGIRDGLAWLVERAGHDVTYVSIENNPDYPYIGERHIAFFRQAVDLGVNLRSENLFFMPFKELGQDINFLANALFNRSNPARAIYLSHIAAAFPLVTLAESMGKRPGRDFHLLLFDDDPNLLNKPGVASLRQRWEDIDASSAQWAAQKRQDKQKPFQRKLKPELITTN